MWSRAKEFGWVLSDQSVHFMVMFGLGGGENAALDLGLFSLCICSYFRDMKNSLTASFSF